MTLEEKAGQLFILGFPNQSIDPEYLTFLSAYKPGSFIIFKRNIKSVEQIEALTSRLYQASYQYSKLPPLIAIDQEGGSVSRLPIYPAQPNALALGKTKSPLLAEEMGYQTGVFLREAGFNMNLAPVLDVSDPLFPSFIGARSFGSDPTVVRDIGVSYSNGLLRAHVIPTAKHFPGTGSMRSDPHSSIVKNNSSIDSLRDRDLVPFQGYTGLGKNIAIMLSHSIFPSLDPSGEPASFSRKISTDLLRSELKYQGLVITDDLQMRGSRQLLRPEFSAVKSLQAGTDIVMMTWSQTDQIKTINAVKLAIIKGEITNTELNSKLTRILHAKAFTNAFRKEYQHTITSQPQHLTSNTYTALEDQILSINIKNNLNATVDLTVQKVTRKPTVQDRVCIISSSADFLTSFKHPKAYEFYFYRLRINTTESDLRSWNDNKHCSSSIITVNGKVSAKLLDSLPLETKRKLIVVNLNTPNLVKNSAQFKKVIQLYFNHKNSGQKIAENLTEIIN
jgi:beta-N-acetylhexosaminidase